MSKLRSINTVIWSDPWFELLHPQAKLLFIYFVTNEKTNMLGVYEISTRKVSFETGIKEGDIKKYLSDFEKDYKIKYSCNRVLLLNFLKHQNYNFNMMKSAIRTYNSLPNELKLVSINNLEETKEGFSTLCEGFGGVRKVEVEYEVEVKDELEIEVKDETESKVYAKAIHDSFEKCLNYFPDHLQPKDKKGKENWLDTIEKLNRLENIPFDLIESIVKKTREDDFWSKNFLSLTKLRKKNKDGIMYVIVFNEKLNTNGKQDNQKTGSTVSKDYVDGIIRDLQS